MSIWSHLICDSCMQARLDLHATTSPIGPLPAPIRLVEEPLQACCFCGEPTNSGLYVRDNAGALLCRGRAGIHVPKPATAEPRDPRRPSLVRDPDRGRHLARGGRSDGRRPGRPRDPWLQKSTPQGRREPRANALQRVRCRCWPPPSPSMREHPMSGQGGHLYVAVGLTRHILRGRGDVLPSREALSMGFTVCGREAIRARGWYLVVNAIGPVCVDCLRGSRQHGGAT